MLLTKKTVKDKAEELGYKSEEAINLEKEEVMHIEKHKIIKRLGEDCWIVINLKRPVKPTPFKIERDNKRRKVWRQFVNCRNYALKYGKQRAEAVAKGIDESSMVEIISDHQFISQQIKTTTSPLSEEDGFTKTLDKIADYILFSKFDDEEQEKEHEKVKEELKELESSKKTEDIKNKIEVVKNKKRNTPYSKTKKLSNLPNQYSVQSLEQQSDIVANGLSPTYIVNYTRVDRQMEKGKFDESMEAFWERFSPSKPNDIPFYDDEPINYKEFAHSTMLQYISEIQELEDKPFTPERAKVISNLKSEMRTALSSLRNVIHFNPTSSLDETIPSDSWNYLSLRNVDTYKILLLNYNELYERYKTKVNTNMWSLLRSFETLIESVKWGKPESVILELMLNEGITQLEEIQTILENESQLVYSKSNLSKIINNKLPSLILKAYENKLEEWVWTYRRKGVYKKCSKCGEVKLAVDTRYFRPDKKGKLGLRGTCKACESE